MSQQLPRVVLIDDYPLFRKAMADVLTASGEFQVLGQTGDQRTALGLAALSPEVVVMGLRSEHYDPMTLLYELKLRHPYMVVIMMMNTVEETNDLMQAIRLDANGYLLRSIEATEFVDQLRKALVGGMAASEKITSALAERLRHKNTVQEEDKSATSLLTQREFDVLSCIASGMSNKEISQVLGIKDGTVKVHVKHVLKKLKFRSRVEVAVWASERGYKHE